MNDRSVEPVTDHDPRGAAGVGAGTHQAYQLIAKREIASVRVGTRQLVNYASLKAFLNSKEA